MILDADEERLKEVLVMLMDQITRDVNRLDLVRRLGPGMVALVTELPTPGEDHHGRVVVLRKNGSANDEVYVCVQVLGGAYQWRQLNYS